MTDSKIKLINQKSSQPKKVATVMNLKVQYEMTRSKSIVLFFFHLEAVVAIISAIIRSLIWVFVSSQL